MDMSNMFSIPNENPNLPPKLKEARDMMRYAAIFFLVAALIYGLWGLWSLMTVIFWRGMWGVMSAVIQLVFAGIALVMKVKLEEDIINPIDYGQYTQAKDKSIIYIILGFIFGMVLSGLLVLLGYMKLGEVDTQANICPSCKSPMRYVQEYQRWYCDNCQDYKVPIHPATPPPQGVQVQQQPQQQQGWQVQEQPRQQQQGWQPPQSQEQPPPPQQQGWTAERKEPEPPQEQSWDEQSPEQQQPQNICPTCEKQARWIQEYSRFYCDNCGKYL